MNESSRSPRSGRRRVAPVRGEHGGQQVVDARVLVGEAGRHGRLDLGLDLAANRGGALVVELSCLAEQRLESRHRILRLPLVDHGAVADVGEVGAHRVLHPPERLHLEERRAAAAARQVERAADGVLDGEHVVAVDDLARHAVAGRAIGEILDRPLRAPVGGERELVVLADEDDGQLPGRGEVHPLVRRALPGRAVAEEGERRLVGAAQRRGQRGAAGVGDPGADDAVAAEDVEREVGDVHRAAEPLAVARSLAEHLGHHPVQVGAGRDQVAVRAVVADEVVGLAHHAGGADGDRLLPDAAVRRPEDHALLEQRRPRAPRRRGSGASGGTGRSAAAGRPDGPRRRSRRQAATWGGRSWNSKM